jgi:hypothetical protein
VVVTEEVIIMDADTLAALTLVDQRLAILEASVGGSTAAAATAAATATAAANATAVTNAEQLAQLQEANLLASQARMAATAELYRPGFVPYPGWRVGTPYPLHGAPGHP